MDTLTAARVELAQPSPSERHDFQTSLQVQNLIRQGEAALIALYKLTSHERGKQPSKASIQRPNGMY
ncbi:hypothetical protein WJX75_002696 [Coccomyxa subellipsoidea]|uniref:Uncharacterized protein n=1 Tax=Coccomyxa subellipsoidea TaxID=248742 RepID=A0ABR2YHG0_9CHLO